MKTAKYTTFFAFVLMLSCSGASNKSRSADFYGCQNGNLDDCHAFATSAKNGTTSGKRDGLAAWQFACFLNHQPSCAEIGRVYGSSSMQVDQRRAAAALRSACDAGEAPACIEYADALPDHKAIPFYTQACDDNQAIGCANLAEIYRKRWRMGDFLVKANALDQKACELGSPKGCLGAGQALLFGSGIDKDETAARALLAKSCTTESGEGCRALAKIYQDGIGIRADLTAANKYYTLADQHTMVETVSTPKSAFLVFVDACNRGNALGCFNAGYFLAEGVEVQRNISTSRAFFERACNEGIDAGCERWKKIQPAALNTRQ